QLMQWRATIGATSWVNVGCAGGAAAALSSTNPASGASTTMTPILSASWKGGPRGPALSCYQFKVTLTRASRPCRMLEGARYAVGAPPAPSAGTPATAVGANVVGRTLK